MANMKLLYLDCFSGISGDMTVAALLDLGASAEHLRKELGKLNLRGCKIIIRKVEKKGIPATKFDVGIDKKAAVEERSYRDIVALIERSALHAKVKETALRIFEAIAAAESKIHRRNRDQLHFHEIGALDTIVDIVGTSVCLHELGIEKVYASELPLGKGFIKFSHGKWPNPGPAAVEMLANAKVPVKVVDIDAELVTPTGAAILAALAEFTLPAFTLEQTGYGAGTKELEHPNVLRAMLGTARNVDIADIAGMQSDSTVLLETNIDDMNPQLYQHVMNALLDAGAFDVFLTNIMMKKQRPGIKLSVICRPEDIDKLSEIIFTETTTLGLRIIPHGRKKLATERRKVKTRYGDIILKLGILNGKIVNIAPEYDDCAKAARKHKAPLKKIMDEAKKQYR